jgi:hypothetical protein
MPGRCASCSSGMTRSGSGGPHVIVGDSSMSETTMLLKAGATDLVLRMVEAGVVLRDMTLDNPIRAIREVSHDMTGRSRGRLANRHRIAQEIDWVTKQQLTERYRAMHHLPLFASYSSSSFDPTGVHLKLNDKAQSTVLCKCPFRPGR